MRERYARVFAAWLLVLFATVSFVPASAQSNLQLDPAKTSVRFTLEAVLHSVHGTFQAKPSALQFDSASGRLSGEIVIDARSGQSGNGLRDRKMHKDVIESDRYPEIAFRPDRVLGAVAMQGKSEVKVHGVFRIHGVDREVEIPADIEMFADHWSATSHFTIPYQKWGMKNPSTLFLRVRDSVEVDFNAVGSVHSNVAARGSVQ